MDGSYGSCVFLFRSWYTVFCFFTILHPYKQYVRVLVPPQMHQHHLVWYFFFLSATIISYVVDIISVSLISNNIDLLFMCLICHCITSLLKSSSNLSPIFKLSCLLSYLVLKILYIFWIQVLYQIHDWQRFFFPPVFGCLSILLFC